MTIITQQLNGYDIPVIFVSLCIARYFHEFPFVTPSLPTMCPHEHTRIHFFLFKRKCAKTNANKCALE